MPRPQLTAAQRRLVGTVAAGAVLIAAIGFVGSYAAVRRLAQEQGFGDFAMAFPIGIDIGIVVLLALDLLLAWLRMPYPLLRHTAWLLTAATIAFNGATAWPDPVGTAMHAVTPLLFVVIVEAARNAVGRIADITADKHMDGVRLTRWLLAPIPTFRLWRRMKLWELRSYEQVIRLEQDRLTYRARLQAQHGRRWRRKAPIQDLLPLRLARYGQPLPAAVAAPAAAPAQQTGSEADFDRVAAEAVALAPPAAVTALESAPLQQAATPEPVAAAAPATPATPPAPTNTVPPGVALLPVACSSQPDARASATPDPAATPAPPATQHPATPVAATVGNGATAAVAPWLSTEPMTVADVAQRLGVTPGTVRSWVNRGKLTPLPRTGRSTRNTFDPAAVAALDTPPATPSQPDRMEGGYA
ncbi:DUF2637 domain-containing protein [Streptomyces rubiginosohelvolus]|uniref:DUF2637 domain-containing protein n=1 Tax=Streptomyces rubiginosohelvolus TaxID=67362 RepID=UPI0038694D6B|nr:DUF2637 domain-containing protein [Streptomyces rubiginosohelvolus]